MNDNVALPCVKCKYDLRATPCASPCPECGTPAEHSKHGYRVEGECLVLRRNARLPQRCALTNVPVTLQNQTNDAAADPAALPGMAYPQSVDMTNGRRRVVVSGAVLFQCVMGVVMFGLFWAGEYVFVIAAISGAMLLCASLLVFFGHPHYRTWASVLYLEGSVARAHGNREIKRLMKYLVFSAGLMIVVCFALGSARYLVLMVIPALFSSVVGASLYERPFAVLKTQNDEGWITGCCDAYLEHCRAERQRMLDEAQLSATTYQPSGGDDCPSA